jgi:hypothetical protein
VVVFLRFFGLLNVKVFVCWYMQGHFSLFKVEMKNIYIKNSTLAKKRIVHSWFLKLLQQYSTAADPKTAKTLGNVATWSRRCHILFRCDTGLKA